ncbi:MULTISPECIES: ABC transporter permease [unclassified Colwellia]|uniref:ABC transporter permease n=1 Tax=unclassified Colwellia TaxID=196834 RepID=UPI0015F41744|nr:MULTISPECIES: ABC transporter permease [unclassified Colwellia]MBA6363438.1 ABC transporter permease [Colwellia sp. BRX8-8]MBA6371136.1 ABC transporter permease [Colwellia sp. BRX8-4]MBA6380239.1 ABC transporter permease [Colwellia sp. BRX10-7]MBA6387455.1 ABC transporter permease [Colwellia sp. BRX10-2]MBA6402538.1 ABC transporter permease [Colwellia sp. BRX10-5]
MRKLILRHKQAWASLKKKPGFVLTVLMTMGITLGALLCAVTLNYLLLVEPLPYPEQDRLFVAQHKLIGAEKETKGVAYTYPGLVHLYKSKEAFEQAAIMIYGQDVIISHSSQPLVNTAYVTPELHQILASPMAMGRMFEASEAMDTNNPVAMLSYNTWKKEYKSSADILNQKINLSGISYRIVGVLSENFVEPELNGIGRETQVWMPWDYNQTGNGQRQSFGNINGGLKFIGQLKNDVSKSQAEQLLTPLVSDRWQEGVAEIGFFKGWSIVMIVTPVKEIILGDSESIAIKLLAGVIGLVLIACLNITNLFMARTAEKQRQMAIQAAIGATKKHLFKGMLAETSLLMFMSIIIALVLAKVGFSVMQQYLGAILPRVSELSINPVTFGSAVLITVVFALFFAKLSTSMINYRALNTTLQSSGKGSGLQVSKKIRQVLIASQVALATVLVFANISLLKDAVKTINAPIGFTTNNISTLILNFSSTEFPTEEEAIPIMAEIMDKLEALPQVESISQTRSPLDGFNVRALTNVSNNERYTPYFNGIDHTYFNMIEQQILQGDNFTEIDRKDGNNIMIVNQAFAKQLKADSDVIGLQISTGRPEPFKIVGIVKDISIPNDTPIGSDNADIGVPRAYIPNNLGNQSFMLKVKPGQTVSREQLGKLLSSVDSRYSVFSYKSADDILTQRLFAEITTAVTTAVLASLVFLLAGIGLYGILSYGTQLRRFELGARMAIGATRKHLLSMIINDNTKAVLIGFVGSVVLFAIAYIGMSEYIQPFITWQALPMVVASLVLIIMVTLFACYWPLRQYINKPAIFSLRGSD